MILSVTLLHKPSPLLLYCPSSLYEAPCEPQSKTPQFLSVFAVLHLGFFFFFLKHPRLQFYTVKIQLKSFLFIVQIKHVKCMYPLLL